MVVKMNAYEDFASVYDIFMEETPYEEWCDFLIEMMEEYGVSKSNAKTSDSLEEEKNLVVDLGCGTGTLTHLLAHKGYQMIGIDYSQEMLSIAMAKQQEKESVLFLHQDMRELDLYSTVGTVYSVCDSLNYILEEEDLLQVFLLVKKFLYPEGLFVFDFNTVYKYEKIIGDTIIAENRENCSFIWENYYHQEEKINEYDITFFVEESDGLYRKFSESHYQRGYTVGQMLELVEKAGLRVVKIMDEQTREGVTETSERVYIIAVK